MRDARTLSNLPLTKNGIQEAGQGSKVQSRQEPRKWDRIRTITDGHHKGKAKEVAELAVCSVRPRRSTTARLPPVIWMTLQAHRVMLLDGF
jgi:hypothetical protein